MSFLRRWLIMMLLCFSGGIIFMLPFLREVYYIPMQQAFGYNNTQMGVLISVFGAVSLVTYFPGGWLADRYSPRKLMSSSLLATGLAGLYFATYPSYTISIIIHGFWGACISLVFWGAMIKTTRDWAPANEQGRAFGILESGRGLAEVGSSTLFLVIFAWLGSNANALGQVINLFAFTNIGLALAAWFIFSDEPNNNHVADEKPKRGLNDVIQVLKMPEVWLISIVVLCAYSAYWGSYYFTPYATDAYALSVVAGASIGVGRMWIKPISALAAGFIADKIGVSKTVFGFYILMTLCFLGFGFLPGGDAYLVLMLINVALVSVAIFAIRGIYFALLDEGGISPAVTGTAAGVISAVGFTPDVFMPLLGGVLLDAYPGAEGYRYYYLVITGICLIGTLAAFIIMRRSANRIKS
ncbi:MAG: putative MFS family arabinose efflux permease [Flavobacterium sp.]|jgi:predicted MFS family arabinose efflux permease